LTPETEQHIIRKVLSGDSNAFEELVLANQTNVYNLAFKMAGNPDDALDISQEAFFKAYRLLGTFRGESRFSVWLYRLTHNLCIDFLRKKTRTASVPLTYQDDEGGTQDIDIPDVRNLPENATLRKEVRKQIADGINQLEPIHREIIVMREIADMSYSEIAQTLSINEGTVKSRLARARKHLVNILLSKGTFPAGIRHNMHQAVEGGGSCE